MLICNSATVETLGIVLCQTLVAKQCVACEDICTLTIFHNRKRKKREKISGLSCITALNPLLNEVTFVTATMLRITATFSLAVLHAKLICSWPKVLLCF